jgi:hypothetical protein
MQGRRQGPTANPLKAHLEGGLDGTATMAIRMGASQNSKISSVVDLATAAAIGATLAMKIRGDLWAQAQSFLMHLTRLSPSLCCQKWRACLCFSIGTTKSNL